MRRLYVVLLILILCGVGIVSADDLPILDADLIFMDNINIIAELPILDTFNEDNTIRYFDPEQQEWQIYNYPQGATLINYSEQRSDGRYLLFNYLNEGELLLYWIERTWIFDPNAGTITRPNEQCGVAQDLPDEGRWIYFRAEDDLVYLCHTETGELSPSLPDKIQGILSRQCQVEIPAVSPNRETVIFSDCNTDGEKTLYLYGTITREFTSYHNSISSNFWLYHIWIGNETVLSISEGYYDTFDVYSTHLGEPEQPQLIAHHYSVRPYINLKSTSPFLIWTKAGDLGDDIVKVDLLTGGSTTLFTKDCGGMFHSMYCSESKFVLNPHNDNYLVLLSEYTTEGITIIDLEQQSIVYQAYTETDSPFAWLNETTFLYVNEKNYNREQQDFMQVEIKNKVVVETPLPSAYTINLDVLPSEQPKPSISTDGHYILSYEYQIDRKSSPTQLFVYDVVSQTRFPITKSLADFRYTVRASWNQDNTIDVMVYESGGNIGKWTISIEN